MMTPIELSSLASLNARISSFTVSGQKSFLLFGRFMVIYSSDDTYALDRTWNARRSVINKRLKFLRWENPQSSSSTFARNPKLHKDVEVDGRKNPPHLGDALSHGLLVDDVDELLPRLVRGGAPLRWLRVKSTLQNVQSESVNYINS